MKPFLRTALPLALSLFAGMPGLHAQVVENGYGMLRGPGYAFLLKAPEGWVIDGTSGVEQGLPAVFYPKGSSWDAGPVVAYARSRPRTKTIATIEDAVNDLVSTFHARGVAGYRGEYLKTLRTDSGSEAVIYRFTGNRLGESEATAYFPEGRSIDFVTLSARNGEEFKAAFPAFEKLVASYAFQKEKIPVDARDGGYFQEGPPKD